MTAPLAWYLGGPTAVGKSALALELAAQIGGEIISVDSMQVYRGLDLGTAKPTPAERARIPHHLIDVAGLTATFDAAKFVALAKAAEQQIRARQRIPIYCGGTGLYFNALLQGLGEAPPSDSKLRAELEATALLTLVAELQQTDPATWARIDKQNPRRVIRAIEVIRLTGKPFSQQRADWSEPPQNLIAFKMDRDALRARIDQRVDNMFAAGLVAETQELLRSGLRENSTASQALGYKQVIEHLDGKISLRDAIELTKVRTRQFAKRQMTWFRGQLPCTWISISPSTSPPEIARSLAQNKS